MTRVSALAPLKAIALVVFLAAIAGATYGVQSILGDNVSGQLLTIEAEKPVLNATGGHTVSFPFTLTNRGATARDVTFVLSGPSGIEARASANLAAGRNTTLFVPVEVPQDLAAGEYALRASLLGADSSTLRENEAAATLRVLEGGEGYQASQVARVLYTGRLAESGRVFNTNDPALAGAGFATTEGYRYTPGILEVRGLPAPNVYQGFYEGVEGMVPGESRTVTFGPEKGDGNATVERILPRYSEILRNETLPLPPAQLSLTDFDAFLRQSGQGEASRYEVGDFITTEGDGRQLRYRIEQKSETSVSLRLHVEVGEAYTVHPYWPNASRVVSVNENGTEAVFETTPTTEVGEAFTFTGEQNPQASSWPDMSKVVSVNETVIRISHDPTVGLQYSFAENQFQQPRTYTVREVREDGIVVVTASTRALAGQTLTFDIELVSIDG